MVRILFAFVLLSGCKPRAAQTSAVSDEYAERFGAEAQRLRAHVYGLNAEDLRAAVSLWLELHDSLFAGAYGRGVDNLDSLLTILPSWLPISERVDQRRLVRSARVFFELMPLLTSDMTQTREWLLGRDLLPDSARRFLFYYLTQYRLSLMVDEEGGRLEDVLKEESTPDAFLQRLEPKTWYDRAHFFSLRHNVAFRSQIEVILDELSRYPLFTIVYSRDTNGYLKALCDRSRNFGTEEIERCKTKIASVGAVNTSANIAQQYATKPESQPSRINKTAIDFVASFYALAHVAGDVSDDLDLSTYRSGGFPARVFEAAGLSRDFTPFTTIDDAALVKHGGDLKTWVRSYTQQHEISYVFADHFLPFLNLVMEREGVSQVTSQAIADLMIPEKLSLTALTKMQRGALLRRQALQRVLYGLELVRKEKPQALEAFQPQAFTEPCDEIESRISRKSSPDL